MKRIFVVVLVFTISLCLFGEGTVDYSNKIIFSDSVIQNLSSKNSVDKVEEPVVVILKLDYGYQPSYDRDSLDENSDVDRFLENLRNEGEVFHSKRNEEILEEIFIEDIGTVEMSRYAPFISLTFSDQSSNSILSIINDIASHDVVSQVDVINYIEEVPQIATNFQRLGFDSYNTYSDYNGYDGTDVTIGILEAGGIVDEDHANFTGTDLIVRNEWYYNETVSDHATLVASIAGGANGIARGATLLSVELSGSPYSEVDWMLDRDVNVVNMSFGSDHNGSYNLPYDAYYDYITRTYFVTFVAASGNWTLDNTALDVFSPATAYNVIAVGSTEDFETMSWFSSENVSFDIHKPNVVAPGENIGVGTIPDDDGTSFAAPHVTGIIALMMDRRSYLKTHPELVNAILTANADPIDFRPNYSDYAYGGCTSTGCKGYENSFGAGEVRIDDSIDNIYKSSYFTIDDNSDYKDNVKIISVYLNAGDELTVSLFWLRNIIDTPSLGLVPEPVLDLDLKLYNPSGSYVYGSSSSSYNNEILTYFATQSGYYSIRVYQYGSFDEGGFLNPGDIDVYGAVAYKIE